MTHPSDREFLRTLELQGQILDRSRASILRATTELELAIEAVIAAYWVDPKNETETDVFVDAFLAKSGAERKTRILKLLLRHTEQEPLYPELLAKIREVFGYRNVLAHGWRHDIWPDRKIESVVMSSPKKGASDYVISDDESARLVQLAGEALFSLSVLFDSLHRVTNVRPREVQREGETRFI